MSNVESSGSLYPRMCKENAQIPLTTYIPSEGDTQMAHIVSLWTQNPNMLPKRPNEISTFFEDGRSVVILDPNGRVAGHAAFTREYPDGSLEVGSLVTNPLLQRKGVAKRAIEALIEHGRSTIDGFDNRRIFALANNGSLGSFIKAGFDVSEDQANVHEDVWGECKGCPMIEAKGDKICCDTLVILNK